MPGTLHGRQRHGARRRDWHRRHALGGRPHPALAGAPRRDRGGWSDRGVGVELSGPRTGDRAAARASLTACALTSVRSVRQRYRLLPEPQGLAGAPVQAHGAALSHRWAWGGTVAARSARLGGPSCGGTTVSLAGKAALAPSPSPGRRLSSALFRASFVKARRRGLPSRGGCGSSALALRHARPAGPRLGSRTRLQAPPARPRARLRGTRRSCWRGAWWARCAAQPRGRRRGSGRTRGGRRSPARRSRTGARCCGARRTRRRAGAGRAPGRASLGLECTAGGLSGSRQTRGRVTAAPGCAVRHAPVG